MRSNNNTENDDYTIFTFDLLMFSHLFYKHILFYNHINLIKIYYACMYNKRIFHTDKSFIEAIL